MAVINNHASTQVEINLTTFIRYDISDTDPLQIGVSMRTWRQFAAHAGVYIGDNIKLLNTYELSKGILGSYNGSSHEILLRYRLQRNKQWGHQRYFESRLFDY